MNFSAREKRDEALREIRFREKVYGRMVNVNQMTRDVAQKRLAIMQEIADDYDRVMQGEDLFPDFSNENTVRSARSKAHRRYAAPADNAGSDRTGEGAPPEPVPPSPEKPD